MFEDDLSLVQNVLVDHWGALSGVRPAGSAVEVVKRNEDISKQSGLWVSAAVLRKKARYQPANGRACLRGANPEEIVNRFLETISKLGEQPNPSFRQRPESRISVSDWWNFNRLGEFRDNYLVSYSHLTMYFMSN